MAGEVLKLLPEGSVLEKIVGKRQSIIFALLFTAILFAYAEKIELASVILGFVGIIVKGYVDDVGSEKAA